MKIAVTGKGGVGKTTFAATLARLYADEGETDIEKLVDLMIERIEEKRTALGI